MGKIARAEAISRTLSDPLSYRIFLTLATGGAQTTAGLGAALSDVPASSLYRHLAKLRAGGFVKIVAERPARGAVERTYALAASDVGGLTLAEAAKIPRAKLRELLRNFGAGFLADFSSYLESDEFDFPNDGAHVQGAIFRCSDSALAALLEKIKAALGEAARDTTSGPLRRRILYTVTVPKEGAPAPLGDGG